jgi:hypothetical protein
MNDFDQTPTYYETVFEETELDLIQSLVQDFRKFARDGKFELDEALAISILDKINATQTMPLVDAANGLTAKA